MSRALLAAVALGGGLLAANCGGSSNGDDDDNNNGASPCDTVYRDQCGTTCSSDTGCPNGLFCGGGTCTAQCTAESGCTGGQTCSARGRCVGGTAGSTGTGGNGLGGGINVGGSGTGGQGGVCPNITVAFEKIIPTIVLLVDQSSSMTDNPLNDQNGSPNRWDALKAALLGDQGVLKTLQGEVRFGMTLYSGQVQSNTPGACLLLTDIPPALNNFQAIFDQYNPAGTINNTPTAESLIEVTEDLKAFAEPGPKFIVLATDGDPDNCKNPNSNGNPEPKAESVSAVTAAFGEGIGTYVIGVSQNSVDRNHLKQLALAGQGKPTDGDEELFFEVGTQEALGNAFKTIVNGARPCSFDIEGTITAEAAPKGTVTIDNQPVPLDPTNGWQLTDEDTITFVGTACTQIQSGASNVQASFPCGTGGVTPNPR